MKKRLSAGMTAPNFSSDTLSGRALNFYQAIRGKKSVLFFLRYAGCPVCQMKIGELIRDHDAFRNEGLEVLVVIQSTPGSAKDALGDSALPFTIVCDPDERIFSLYRVSPGNVLQYIAPSVLLKALKAFRGGYRHGKKEGNEMQLPAVFIVSKKGNINYAYYGRNIADVPDNEVILRAARA